jgi:hypothetical protein
MNKTREKSMAEKVYAFFKRHAWIQGTNRCGDCYCLGGAAAAIVGGFTDNPAVLTLEGDAARRQLAVELGFGSGTINPTNAMVNWNDLAGRARKDILDRLREAVQRQRAA